MGHEPTQVRLLAARSQVYRGRALRPRDSFVADEVDAADLVALKYAVRDTTPEPASRTRYRRRDMRADETTALVAVDEPRLANDDND